MNIPVQKPNNHTLKNNCRFLLLFSVFFATPIFAKSYLILLKNGAPSLESIVAISENKAFLGELALSSFKTLPPDKVGYLLRKPQSIELPQMLGQKQVDDLEMMYRYLVVEYSDQLKDEVIINHLLSDKNIVDVIENEGYQFTSNNSDAITSKYEEWSDEHMSKSGSQSSSFLTDLNIISAWELSEGMGYIGAMDTGFQTDHPDLMTFDAAGNYLNGNILDVSGVSGFSYQEDVGMLDFNVDEKQPIDTRGWQSLEPCDLQDGVNDNYATPTRAGHGTHVTGILTGKGNTVSGVCKNCGMSMMKLHLQRSTSCIEGENGQYTLESLFTRIEAERAIENFIKLGVGTINFSGSINDNESCEFNTSNPLCKVFQTLVKRNILLVAAGGNDRNTKPNHPAREIGAIAVGGLDESAGFWNESPGPLGQFDMSDQTDCPYYSINTGNARENECGSNFSADSPLGRKIDVMAQARNVYSTFYHGAEHVSEIACTDISDGIIDGYGYCTGTSMSTPQIAGIVQLMRSAHPLLPNGTYDPSLMLGLINILNATSSLSTSGLGFDDYHGYGVPDARLALETILGQSNEQQMKTRLTPMFELSSSGHSNNVYTPFSQLAVSFLSRPDATYLSNSNASNVNEFAEFWYDKNAESYDTPKAAFYVFTTNNNPFSGVKDMVPLRRMEKTSGNNRNDTYVVNTNEIESYRLNGYNFAGIEGYILPPGSGQPTGSIGLYRDQSNSMNHKLIPANSAPNGSSVLLGYVYLNEDTDNDGLIDGQEIILGTDINDGDTDGDGMSDPEEYPPAGVPVSDPMVNPNQLKWLPAVVDLILS